MTSANTNENSAGALSSLLKAAYFGHLILVAFVAFWIGSEGTLWAILMVIVFIIEAGGLYRLLGKIRGHIEAGQEAVTQLEEARIAAASAGAQLAELEAAKTRAEEALADATAAATMADTAGPPTRDDAGPVDAGAEAEATAQRLQSANDFERDMSTLMAEIAEVSHKLEEEAELLATIAGDTENLMKVATGATGNVSGNVNAVASSAEEMSASVAEISRQVNMSAGVADQARGYANDSEKRIHELADRADKINDVLKMIGDIAEQTNLLALNATIEAARAGDAGRGFAVVASEVKSLANQSASATEEIGKLLAGIRDATGEAVDVNKKIVSVIGQISENSSGIASAVEEQSAATEEIARAAQHAAADTIEAGRSVENMNNIVDKISKAAEITAGAVNTLSDKTNMLSVRAEDFTNSVRG